MISSPQLLTLLVAAVPFSSILIICATKIFSKHNSKLENTTVICTNIKEPLTKPELIVRSIFFDKYKLTSPDEGNLVEILDLENKNEIKMEKESLKQDETLRLMAIITNLCHYEKIKKFEEIIKIFFLKIGFGVEKIKNDFEIIEKINSPEERKISTTIVIKKETKEIFALSKGNPQTILNKCMRVILDNKKIDLTLNLRRKIKKNIEKLNKNGQKVIGFAFKPLPFKKLEKYSESFAENEMVFIGFTGITNPINKGILESIETSKELGLKTYILTSEKEKKAMAIGRILNIINPEYSEGITSSLLRQIHDQKLKKLLSNKEKDYVFAELNIEDKDRIIKILRELGENVVIASQKTSYSEIVEGVKKGKEKNTNNKKIIKHSIGIKIAEIFLILMSLILSSPPPLSISLILTLDIAINLILEIGIKQNEKIPESNKITKKDITEIIISGLFLGVAVSFYYYINLMRHGWTLTEGLAAGEIGHVKTVTSTFILLIIIQIIHSIKFQNHRGIFLKERLSRNIYLILTIIIAILITYMILKFESFKMPLKLTEIGAIEWQIMGFTIFSIILIRELKNFLFYTFKK